MVKRSCQKKKIKRNRWMSKAGGGSLERKKKRKRGAGRGRCKIVQRFKGSEWIGSGDGEAEGESARRGEEESVWRILMAWQEVE